MRPRTCPSRSTLAGIPDLFEGVPLRVQNVADGSPGLLDGFLVDWYADGAGLFVFLGITVSVFGAGAAC